RGRRVLERTAESPYTRPERRRDDYLADTVSVAEAHLFSFRLFSIRGYIKRQGPNHKARAFLHALRVVALRLLVGPALHLFQVAFETGEHGVEAPARVFHR